jgi:DNA polymerase-1
MNTCGAITSRGIHFDPNLGQVPAVQKDKQGNTLKGIAGGFGWECRSKFIASEGLEMTGTDASSLELLCLGHYLAPFDGGAFSERVSDPDRDPHTEHGEITGLNRNDTKTVTYLSIYGGGAGRAAEELELEDGEQEGLLAYQHLPMLLRNKARMEGDDYREPSDREKALLAKGHKVIKAFETGIPGWKDLKDKVTEAGRIRRWLRGLDGRKLYIRKPHASLNTLLQGAGAIICKLWMILLHTKLASLGLGVLVYDPGFGTVPDAMPPVVLGNENNIVQQLAWVHDELQFEHTPGLGDLIGKLSREAIREAGEILQFRGVLRSDYKTGRSWAETH